jgi:PadR family transcriptional regulator PadR
LPCTGLPIQSRSRHRGSRAAGQRPKIPGGIRGRRTAAGGDASPAECSWDLHHGLREARASALARTLSFRLTSQLNSCYFVGVSNGTTEKTEVLQGTLDLMVLQTLDVLGPSHGYAIAARVEQVSKGAIRLNMGTLYPALMRLEQRGLLRGTWGVSDTGLRGSRRARFYKLTAAGRRELAARKQAWDRMTAIMQALLEQEA